MKNFRNLLLTVLSTTATKREARNYIQKYGLNAARRLVSIVRVSGRGNHSALQGLTGQSLGRTLSHLKDLGSYPVVVLDGEPQIASYLGPNPGTLGDYRSELSDLANNLGGHLHDLGQRAQLLSAPFELSVDRGLVVKRDWLDQALAYDRIPVMLPFMYDLDSNESKMLNSYEACRTLALSLHPPNEDDNRLLLRPELTNGSASGENSVGSPGSHGPRGGYVLDKVIFIDPIGGLPSQRRKHAAHVIVNLQQEFGEVSAEIRSSQHLDGSTREAHLANLNAMRDILTVGGPKTSGLITDPAAAGNVLDRNPIVYNLLTERPLISPSLPAELERTQLRTSLIRTGFPVEVRGSADPEAPLDLRRLDKVGSINLTKLVNLIELSFGKKLDLDHYLARLDSRVAAVIVVGDYDGAAIISWETSKRTGRKIAYLDKFAVNPSSQGAQGVADIMLIQMIRRLFPSEMLWRSRYNNPVNKWYFERSRGHLRLLNSHWTMFWISNARIPPVDEYADVCSSIEPSFMANTNGTPVPVKQST